MAVSEAVVVDIEKEEEPILPVDDERVMLAPEMVPVDCVIVPLPFAERDAVPEAVRLPPREILPELAV